MWLWVGRPLRKPQPHDVNQVRLFGPFFHQEALHMSGNHFLSSNSHLGQWKSYSWCMQPRVHITNVDVCSSQLEGVYLNPNKVWLHREANLWRTQRNLVGIGKCWSTNDSRWFPMTPRYLLLRLETQEGHLAFTQKPSAFHLVRGLCSSSWCFLFSGCKWGEWDLSPFHHRDLDTYIASGHAPIRSQHAYFYGCHV